MGKDSQILHRFTKVDDQAFCGSEVGGCQDGSVWIGGTGIQWKSGDVEAGSLETHTELIANTS